MPISPHWMVWQRWKQSVAVAGANNMVVQNNPMLGNCCIIPCHLEEIDGVLSPFTGKLSMSGNMATCNSYASAATACAVTSLTFTVSETSGTPDDYIICTGTTVDLAASASVAAGSITFDFFIDVDNSGDFTPGDILISSVVDAMAPYTAATTYNTFSNGDNVMVTASNNSGGCDASSAPVTITVGDITPPVSYL